MLLTGRDIRDLGLVSPCEPKNQTGLSYGLEPSGYTIRLADKWKFVNGGFKQVLDPLDKKATNEKFSVITSPFFILPPKHYVLGRALEYIALPNNITAFITTKSSYTRLGVFANTAPIDPGWRGFLTLCIVNLGQAQVKIYANQGIAQVNFYVHDETFPYGEKGIYQELKEIKI